MELLTTKQAGKILGVVTQTVVAYIQRGDLEATRTGPHPNSPWAIRPGDVEKCKKKLAKRSPNRPAVNPTFTGGKFTNAPQKWRTVDEQIRDTMAGKVKPVYLSRDGQPLTVRQWRARGL